jgi:hypothetical protein
MSATSSPSHGPTMERPAPARTARAVHASLTPSTYRRRRLKVLAGLVLLVFALTVFIGRVGAEAELADPVAGHVVVEPGNTLWDVAVDTAPEGVDPRRQLAELRELNGFDGAHLEAWTVVLIPAR